MSCVVPDGPADPNPGTCVLDLPEPGTGSSPPYILYNGEQVYLSGVNVAWLDFAFDFGNGLNEAGLRQMLDDVKAAGGNTIRWWVHTDGSQTPEWGTVNGERRIIGPGGSFLADMKQALDIAGEYGIYIVPSLWSFDMLRNNDYRKPPVVDNYNLLTNDAVLQSYIDNALVPMVQALNNHPQLIAWELFNEPENMTESWFRAEDVVDDSRIPTRENLVRTQAKMAAAIHLTAEAQGETALVTTGSKSMGKYNSDVAGGANWYRDDRMIEAADGDEKATLDFYEPHYYNNEGREGAWSPFHHHANYWGVDKPIVIGEFHAGTLDVMNDPVTAEEMCQRLVDNGYAGGWPWQYIDDAERPEILACLRNVNR